MRVFNNLLYLSMKKIDLFINPKAYQIDEYGNIYSNLSKKYLKSFVTSKGYRSIELQGKKYLVHRLVLQAFNPINEKLDCNHIDGNKLNNHISNLEWLTRKQNIHHAIKKGLHDNGAAWRKAGNLKRAKDSMIQILDTETGIFYNSMRECSKAFGFNNGYISLKIKRGNKRFNVI